ncbi:SDR family NAD(P)-dependent oxidoreductase [Phytohabitans kaempferiae]|uniref:SDR family NAD(P)-dependent oxidoreductase n=1 Tax=Phytohabitans kaempferiae TaxID=1620943 RepID=A0ABV6LZ55_9ACTN
MNTDLTGRTVVVAGAGGGGIGTAVAAAVGAAGAHVVAVDRDPERLAPAVERLRAAGASVAPVVADVLDAADRAAVVAAAREAPAPLYGLVTVAGGIAAPYWGPTLDVDPGRWREVVALNLDYVAFLGAELARLIVDGGGPGAVVAVSSVSGIGAAPFHAPYGAAKAGLISLVRTLALEWSEHGIRVNAVAPGTIATPTSGAAADPGRDRAAVPLGRRGRPEEVAGAVLFLLSDLAAYVTGQCLAVDGGMSVKGAHLADDNTPVFVTDPAMRAAMRGGADRPEPSGSEASATAAEPPA